MGFFGRLFGGRGERPEDLPDVCSGEPGDLTFRITESGKGRDRSFRMVARATYQGEPVGFALELGPSWSGEFGKGIGEALGNVLGGELGEMFAGAMGQLSLEQGAVTFRSIGYESDNLIAAMSWVYRTRPPGAAMKQSVAFMAIAMQGNPANPASGPVRMKLFFEGEDEDYAEMYTNFDLPFATLEIREKDASYRAALLRALAEAER